MIIAQYKFDKSIYNNLIPEFNTEFTNYKIIDDHLDTEDIVATSLETMLLMNYDAEPDEYGILTTEYAIENVNTFSSENIVTRTIYSNELPTLMRFGNPDTSGETGDYNKYNSLLEVLYLASSEITYAGLMFHRCANVSYICPFILTNKNNSLHGIFSGCHSLTTLNVSNFDTSNVTDMSYAFYTNNLIELDLSGWDTSNVTNMNHILYSCQNLKTLNISNWNLDNVNNMGWFVNQCNKLNEIIMNDSDYNSVNKIISELPITTNGVECNFYIGGVDDISKVDVREGWGIANQYKIAEYIANKSGCLPVFDEGYQYNVNETIIGDNLYSVEISSSQLPTSISFNGNINLIEVHYINTKNLTSTYYLFNKCTNLTYVNLVGADFSNVETIECMFAYCSNLLSIDGLNDINVSKVNNMGGLFTDCPKIQKIEVNSWDVSKVTNFGAVFRRCSSLNKIDVSKWDTSNGIIMSGIFTNCSNLTIMDVSSWVVGNANTISQMFYGCKKLATLTLFKYVDPNVQTTYLFGQCTALNKVKSINSDYNTINILIDELLARTEANPGTLDIQGVDNLSLVDLELAKSKHWNIYDKASCKPRFIGANKKPGKIKSGEGNVCIVTTHKRKI